MPQPISRRSADLATAPDDPSRAAADDAELRAIVAGLSHELCRPLISLRAGFDLLLTDQGGPLPDDRVGQVRMMSGICDDLLKMTRGYLDFAGLAHGSRPSALGLYALSAFSGDLGRQFAEAAGEKKLRWSCGLAGPDATVATDAAICQQIFANLASNAIKYAPEGGAVDVTVGLGPAGRRWFVRVADDGPGIPAEEREKVFAPFYRLGRDQKARIEGHGLGLAICKELARQLGGAIELGDGDPAGTVATAWFPTVKGP